MDESASTAATDPRVLILDEENVAAALVPPRSPPHSPAPSPPKFDKAGAA